MTSRMWPRIVTDVEPRPLRWRLTLVPRAGPHTCLLAPMASRPSRCRSSRADHRGHRRSAPGYFSGLPRQGHTSWIFTKPVYPAQGGTNEQPSGLTIESTIGFGAAPRGSTGFDPSATPRTRHSSVAANVGGEINATRTRRPIKRSPFQWPISRTAGRCKRSPLGLLFRAPDAPPLSRLS